MVALILLSGCRHDLYDVPYPSDITKANRESIGVYINKSILEDPLNYPLLQLNDINAPAFHLVQSLYDQVTNIMRQDNKSPDSNQWHQGRKWKIRIINSEDQRAFVIPGGDLYLSTGILKSLNSESELYYILAMEATLMNEKYLLKEMISAYSTKTLMQIAENESTSDDRINNISLEIPLFSFGLELTETLGYKTSELICQTSIYNPKKGATISEKLSKTDQWLSTRPISTNNDQSINCGKVNTKGLYQTKMLDRIN